MIWTRVRQPNEYASIVTCDFTSESHKKATIQEQIQKKANTTGQTETNGRLIHRADAINCESVFSLEIYRIFW